MGDGLGEFGVERLVGEIERLEADLLQLTDQLVEQRADLVGVLHVRRLGRVEHRQQRVRQLARGPFDLEVLLVGGTLAEVLEVGLLTHRQLTEPVDLGEELGAVGLDGLGAALLDGGIVVDVGDVAVAEPGGAVAEERRRIVGHLDTRHLTGVVVDLGPALVVGVRGVVAHESSSSTISASTMSSSPPVASAPAS